MPVVAFDHFASDISLAIEGRMSLGKEPRRSPRTRSAIRNWLSAEGREQRYLGRERLPAVQC